MNKLIIIFILLFTVPCFAGVTFDGSDDGISLGDLPGFDGSLTIAAWVKIHTRTDDSAILAQYDGVNSSSSFLFRIDTTAHPSFVTNAGAGAALYTCTPTITLNVWNHVAVVYDGSSNVDLYINGVECSAYSSTSLWDIADEATVIWIGRRVDANDEADGDYLEVTAWNTALTPNQIELLALNKVIRFPLQISPSNILIDFPLDECADGAACNGLVFKSLIGTATGTGDDGAGNTGMTGFANNTLTYN